MQTVDIQKFNALVDINTRINSSIQDLTGLLTEIIDSAAKLCDAEASSLLLLDRKTDLLYFEVALGPKGMDVKRFQIDKDKGIAGWVVKHNEPVVLTDAENDERHIDSISNEIGYFCKTMLAVPMRVKNECIGVIELINKKNGQFFSGDDMDWLLILANHAALAIINAQNIKKAQNEIRQLQVAMIEKIDKWETEDGYHTFIAKSPVILEKLELIDRIAQTNSSVLILGESGVGKELFAEQIHLRGPRKKAPFVRVNCAALPDNLFESELFGHKKGAFTGAISDRKGRFETANGGTVFLDEIGELSLSMQAKLLRVLQDKTFERVGDSTPITVDVRVLAATNRDIEVMVKRGEFRNDLYYRISVFPLLIPPLRQRMEDITELANFFLKKFMMETKKIFAGFSTDAVEAMFAYPWPGNIRELENCIERACVLATVPSDGAHFLNKNDLFLKIDPNEEETCSLKTAVTIFKTRFIKKALYENEWNQTKTAKALDIQRTYLSKLIQELGIKE
ncbi:MAG: sigma 54-interacting transcriptional regulator [Treponema sp.]|jgi:Nif-specific regulatory protein|nr:sigma 54-interacting transcriptional regulator [Treponema sp.]